MFQTPKPIRRSADKSGMTRTLVLLLFLVPGLASPLAVHATDNETCLDCHDDPDMEELYVAPDALSGSVHEDLDCVYCHEAADVEEQPHDTPLEPVLCGSCHDDVQMEFDISSHGQALNRKAPYAPACSDCHGTHKILSPEDTNSEAYRMNIPFLCGKCHREGAPVDRIYDLYEHNIIENYSQSIHGEGLFQKGLTVTATCASCHEAHKVLPHTDPRASISPRNIAATCMQCHSRIEGVHTQIIRGELWEKQPGAIPACTDCHLPHKARKEVVALTVSDLACLECHESPDVFKVAEGDTVSLTVDKNMIRESVHENIPCVKCHSDIDPRLKRPCETAGRAECANCHAKMSDEYNVSGHGQAFANKVPGAPYCTTCHGDHDVKSHREDGSSTFRAAVPELCGDCHRPEGAAPQATELTEISALTDYSKSVHGKGLTEKGLLPSAICIDCHGAHMILKHTDERSSVFAKNVPATCATCHQGIYKQFIKSIHYSTDGEKEKLPNCTDCHSAHTIGEVKQDAFMTEVTHQCGSCHEHLAETYMETMHGKAYQLGYLRSAKCSDCHGAHLIKGVNDPTSSVGFQNIVATCQQCHEDAGARFTGYLTHATHHDRVKYPILFYTYWAMTGLLIGVFSFFGLHTLLWLPRSFRAMLERRKAAKREEEERYHILRFTLAQRLTHLFVILSFLSLALTGMTLKFSYTPWASFIADLLGGVKAAGNLHRLAAVVTFGYFAFHLLSLARYKRARRLSLKRLIFGQNSLMFNLKDLRDFGATMKWFFNLGPRPEYGRWTYWEKFDYMAVFWGVAVIGLSGLMLWFPEFFTRWLPGWLINVANIVHSDEALLAVGFIFTIHFFNTHLRPEAFPMDMVIFTGTVPLSEYKKDRPQAYAELKRTGELAKRVVRRSPQEGRDVIIRVFGFTFLGIGVILIALIIYSVVFGYK